MGLISLIVILIVVGLLLYLVETTLQIDPTIVKIIRAVVIVVIILWLLQIFVGDLPIPRLHITS